MKSEDAAKTSDYTGPINVMTVREVSAYLHVHPGTIYKLLKRHQIPAFHVGSDWRFKIEDDRQLALSAGEARRLIFCRVGKHRLLCWADPGLSHFLKLANSPARA